MSSRNPGNLHPFRPLENGLHDLESWNDEYWERNPFNPKNNINYTELESGLPVRIECHPSRRENPFFRSTPVGTEARRRIRGRDAEALA